MKNVGLKSFSVLVALVLAWYVHSGSNSSIRTFVSSIEIRRLPPGKVVLSPVNPHAQVTIKGPAFIVNGIAEAPPIFKITLPKVNGDRFPYPLDQSALAIPSHVEVLNIDPPQIDFILDSVKEKTLTVSIPRVGVINEDLKLEAVSADPNTVKASGPESELDGVVSVDTEPLDLRDIKGDTEIELAIRPIGNLVHLAESKTRVTVRTTQLLVQRHFDKIPIEVRARPGVRYSVVPADVAVNVSGLRKDVEKLARNSIVAYVRIPEDATGKFSTEIGIEAPRGITVQSYQPLTTSVAEGGTATDKSDKSATVRTRDGRKR